MLWALRDTGITRIGTYSRPRSVARELGYLIRKRVEHYVIDYLVEDLRRQARLIGNVLPTLRNQPSLAAGAGSVTLGVFECAWAPAWVRGSA